MYSNLQKQIISDKHIAMSAGISRRGAVRKNHVQQEDKPLRDRSRRSDG